MKPKQPNQPKAPKSKSSKSPVPARGSWRVNNAQVDYVHNQLLQNKYPSTASLAFDLSISTKTVKRIVYHMRMDRDLPVAVSRTPGKRGYYYSRPVSERGGRTFTEQELMNYFISQRSVEQFPVKGKQKRLGLGFDPITQLVDQRTIKLLDELEDAVYFRPFAPERIDVELFFALTEAILKRRVVEFDYTKFMAEVPERKRVRPYCFTCAANSWYLIAYDTRAREMRTYMLSRLKNPNITVEKFDKPKRFSLAQHFKGAFIVLRGKESHDVVVEFDAWAAAYIRNREITPGQKMEELPNGGLRVSMHLTALEEVEAWVCYWRQHAHVVAPVALRERLFAYGQYLVKTYAPDVQPNPIRTKDLTVDQVKHGVGRYLVRNH